MIPEHKDNVRGYREPMLRCASCSSEFFEKISVNNFRTTPIDLFNGQKEMNPEHKVSLLRCICCGELRLPTTSYSFLQGQDKFVHERLLELIGKANKKVKEKLDASDLA